jgi:hypothetical protein
MPAAAQSAIAERMYCTSFHIINTRPSQAASLRSCVAYIDATAATRTVIVPPSSTRGVSLGSSREMMKPSDTPVTADAT